MNKKDEWQKAMEQWLEGFPWQWICALTFWPGVTPQKAKWCLRKWTTGLEKDFGTRNFGWVGAREFGCTGTNLHYHVLLMGLEDWGPNERVEAMRRWGKRPGRRRFRNQESHILANSTGGRNSLTSEAKQGG
jgi:hypothetical protein